MHKSIHDHGIGIPKEQQAHIFERFVRASNTNTYSIGGTGLGLYLSRELVERFGGHIWFESSEGSTFFVALPLYKEILKLDFRTLPLFEEDATKYVETSAICMYSLLPTMEHVNATLIRHACTEMKTYYYERDEDSIFRDNIIWMKVFLDGPNKIPLEEKQKIKEVLVMHGLDRLWEEDPDVRQTFAAGEAKGKAEGLAEGKIEGQLEGLRTSVEMATNARFPSLTDLAHQKVATIKQAETLSMLLQHIITAPNEETALWLLLPQKPS